MTRGHAGAAHDIGLPEEFRVAQVFGCMLDWPALRRAGSGPMIMAVLGAGLLGTLIFGVASIWEG